MRKLSFGIDIKHVVLRSHSCTRLTPTPDSPPHPTISKMTLVWRRSGSDGSGYLCCIHGERAPPLSGIEVLVVEHAARQLRGNLINCRKSIDEVQFKRITEIVQLANALPHCDPPATSASHMARIAESLEQLSIDVLNDMCMCITLNRSVALRKRLACWARFQRYRTPKLSAGQSQAVDVELRRLLAETRAMHP